MCKHSYPVWCVKLHKNLFSKNILLSVAVTGTSGITLSNCPLSNGQDPVFEHGLPARRGRYFVTKFTMSANVSILWSRAEKSLRQCLKFHLPSESGGRDTCYMFKFQLQCRTEAGGIQARFHHFQAKFGMQCCKPSFNSMLRRPSSMPYSLNLFNR